MKPLPQPARRRAAAAAAADSEAAAAVRWGNAVTVMVPLTAREVRSSCSFLLRRGPGGRHCKTADSDLAWTGAAGDGEFVFLVVKLQITPQQRIFGCIQYAHADDVER